MRIAVAVVIAGIAITGCGQEATAAAPTRTDTVSVATVAASTPSTSPRAALRGRVQDYSDAFLTGRAARAYAILSDRCQTRTSRTAFAAIVGQAKAAYGSPVPISTFRATIRGPLARVTYTYPVRAINQTREPWVLEHGKWHEDDC